MFVTRVTPEDTAHQGFTLRFFKEETALGCSAVFSVVLLGNGLKSSKCNLDLCFILFRDVDLGHRKKEF